MGLIEPVRAALRQFQCIVLQAESFDPATVERAFTLAVPGSVESYLVPRLLALLRREAPGVCLTLRGLNYGTVLHELDTDQIDLGIGVITEGQAHHRIRSLYRFGYLCLFNADLLDVPTPILLDDYLRFPHIMTSMTGTDRGLVDVALDATLRPPALRTRATRTRHAQARAPAKQVSRDYSMGSRRGRGPSENAASIRASSASVSDSAPAPALSAACSGLDALGIVKEDGRRTRNRSATWRAVAPWRAAMSCNTRPPGVRGPGKLPWPNGL